MDAEKPALFDAPERTKMSSKTVSSLQNLTRALALMVCMAGCSPSEETAHMSTPASPYQSSQQGGFIHALKVPLRADKKQPTPSHHIDGLKRVGISAPVTVREDMLPIYGYFGMMGALSVAAIAGITRERLQARRIRKHSPGII